MSKNTSVQDALTEDDVKDLCDYIAQVLGSNAVNITRSDFRKIVAPKIQFVSCENWVKIFSILWNKNEELSHLFSLLINEYKKLNSRQISMFLLKQFLGIRAHC